MCGAADVNLIKVPSSLTDQQVLFLSDILCTAWHANELGEVKRGDVVAVWGAGPGNAGWLDHTLYLGHFTVLCPLGMYNH